MENQSSNPLSVAQVVRELQEQIAQTCIACGRAPDEVRFMAVTKTVPPERVNEAIDAGITLLGENKAQELLSKYELYHRDRAEIHFIGHLQSNKVRQIVDKVSMIQSLDSVPLAQEIERQCAKVGKIMDCLAEVNVGGELSKSGVAPEQLLEFLQRMSAFSHLRVRGIMAIPPICDSECEQERIFSQLQQLFIDMKGQNVDNVTMEVLSMGMSGDYRLAIKHGATLVRLGTILFGERFAPI